VKVLTVAWGTVAALSIIVMALVDVLKHGFDRGTRWPGWVWALTALIVGVAVAVIWRIDAIQAAPPQTSLQGLSGEVLTGILACGGASIAHGATGGLYAAKDRLQNGNGAERGSEAPSKPV